MNAKKCVRAWVCLYLTFLFTIPPISAQELKTGDRLPPELWALPLQVIQHPEGRETITLGEYKDKLIILDFWATHCGPCIKSLYKLDSLQKKFGKQLAVVPVTLETAAKAGPVFKKRGWSLLSVTEGAALKTYFPYQIIPHQVWVHEGKVLSVARAAYATESNIREILMNREVKMVQKKDILSTDPVPVPASYFSSSLSRRIPRTSTGFSTRKKSLDARNHSFKSLLMLAYGNEYSMPAFNDMLIWEVADSLKNELSEEGKDYTGNYDEDMKYEQWLDRNKYCYSLTVDENTPVARAQLYEIMRRDIAHYLRILKGVEVSLSKREMEQWILSKRGNTSGFQPVKRPAPAVRSLMYALEHQTGVWVVPDISVPGDVTVTLDSSVVDISSARKKLHEQGLDLVRATMEKEVLIFSPAKL